MCVLDSSFWHSAGVKPLTNDTVDAEGQEPDYINSSYYFYKCFENLVNPLCSKVILIFNLAQALYVYNTISMDEGD